MKLTPGFYRGIINNILKEGYIKRGAYGSFSDEDFKIILGVYAFIFHRHFVARHSKSEGEFRAAFQKHLELYRTSLIL